MANASAQSSDLVLEPSTTAVRKLFRASAQALMANRPLREVARAAGEPTAMLSKSELGALEETGLSTRAWVGDAAHDPLTKTIVDYMALIETSLTTAQAAAMLGVDLSRIRQRIRSRSLVGVEYEGEWRLPRFQFERKKVLPGLAEVLAVLPPALNPLDVATWFLAPNIDLEATAGEAMTPVSPRAWLLRGDPPGTVAQLARHL
jgi:hypothetical protein